MRNSRNKDCILEIQSFFVIFELVSKPCCDYFVIPINGIVTC